MALQNIGIRFGHVGEDEFLRLRQQTASQRSALFRDHFHDISGDRRSDDRPLSYALELMQEEQAYHASGDRHAHIGDDANGPVSFACDLCDRPNESIARKHHDISYDLEICTKGDDTASQYQRKKLHGI